MEQTETMFRKRLTLEHDPPFQIVRRNIVDVYGLVKGCPGIGDSWPPVTRSFCSYSFGIENWAARTDRLSMRWWENLRFCPEVCRLRWISNKSESDLATLFHFPSYLCQFLLVPVKHHMLKIIVTCRLHRFSAETGPHANKGFEYGAHQGDRSETSSIPFASINPGLQGNFVLVSYA